MSIDLKKVKNNSPPLVPKGHEIGYQMSYKFSMFINDL